MVIVLDSNILVRDFNLEGIGFRLLREGLQLVDFRVVIPNIVLDETVAKFRDRIAEESTREQKVLKAMSLLLTQHRHKVLRPINLSYEVQAYRIRLFNKICEAGFETKEYPKVSHEEVVGRELQRIKPFGPHGGYRDYLIWLTVIEVALETNDSVAFITSNTKDFLEGTQLHPDLIKDLNARKIDHQRIEPFSSLETFNDTWLKTQREAVEDVMRSLVERKYMRIPLNSATDSGRNRPAIPEQSGRV
jgi:hypothetical protein